MPTYGGQQLPGNFGEKINKLFQGFKLINAHTYELLVINTGYWYDNLEKLKLELDKLKENGLKCNIKKSFFSQTKIQYWGFRVAREVI